MVSFLVISFLMLSSPAWVIAYDALMDQELDQMAHENADEEYWWF